MLAGSGQSEDGSKRVRDRAPKLIFIHYCRVVTSCVSNTKKMLGNTPTREPARRLARVHVLECAFY